MRVPDPLYQHHLGEDHQLPLRAVGGRVRHPLPAVQHPRCVHTCQARSPLLGQQQRRREDGAEDRIKSKYNRFNFNPPATSIQFRSILNSKLIRTKMYDVKCSTRISHCSLNTQKSVNYRGDPSSNPVPLRGSVHTCQGVRETVRWRGTGGREKREERSLVGWLNPVIYF